MKLHAWQTVSRAKSLREFLLDARRYWSLSTPSSNSALAKLDARQLECQVTKDYHRIEKGLALASPKRPFGADAHSRLQVALPKDRTPLLKDEAFASHAATAIDALKRWNDSGQIDDVVSPVAASLPTFDIDEDNLTAFFESRRSVRAFDPTQPVDPTVVMKAVRLAGNSPSVCNRQAWKAHLFTGKNDVARIMRHQSGNRGFGPDAAGVLIVTANVELFSGSGERNQRWIDGGLFAMSLVYALHGLGIATCMLNWSKGNKPSDALRAEAGLEKSEDIVVLIAVGHPIEDHRVARSPRRSLTDTFVHHSA
ncbi:nitroreductase family protein [Arthrobacter sp. OAP107]|uniref:nitroreductase family protein n=1 Tax=Arthrobacter sp. OAP107 TaxID=3156445 RepID=UPI00339B5AC1